MRRALSAFGLAALLALAACTGPTTSPTTATTSPTSGSPGPSADRPAGDTPTSAPATVHLTGPAGAAALTVEAPAGARVTTTPAAPGSTRVTVSGLARGSDVVVRATAPDGASLRDELDGTIVVEAAGGAALGGLARPGETAEVERGRVVLSASGTVTLWVGAGTPRSAAWGTHDGGRSLAVDPNPWARAAGLAGGEATWSALVVDHPDANRPGMHDQLVCHALGAPDKATWNLEPWRPDVGLVATLAARCNPS
ncbi:DUF2599 domain-containing protein [Luteimicrobium sp. DT211]|uniref:DUF2599 domain-containing protein n=1 Tax=Luteimicrobium sp. DT211 TaxID=3393412 RepID=UPI003CEDB363